MDDGLSSLAAARTAANTLFDVKQAAGDSRKFIRNIVMRYIEKHRDGRRHPNL
jgi:hypothetical protein